ncbi:hypothetical protein HK101_011808 [Irineochytrium annulatum]|nr:hypothetical protein HK101_011808 [Irineochytrium annulatum]
MVVWYNGVQQFMCQMTNCTQSLVDSNYQWYCNALSCQCTGNSYFCGGPPGNTINLSSNIQQANGDFKFTCPQNSTDCKANFGFLATIFPNGLSLPNCQFGECAQITDDPALQSINSTSVPLTVGAEVGLGITGLVVLLVIAGFVWAAVHQSAAIRRPVPPPRKGATMAFRGVSYTIGGGKRILTNVNGVAAAGKVLAIMGPSGAGKSTLLDILGLKSKRGEIGGTVTVDGQDLLSRRSQLRSMIGYVDQEDLLMPTLTVRETLMFSATLRLPESVPREEKSRRVQEVMDTLGLTHVADVRVGGFGKRGISGGEKRRVTIGVELVTSPAVLLLDEPTSGLDSYNALSVVRALADLAHVHGKTVVFTIHQPRSDVYTLFDEVLVLADGSPIYSGPGAGAGTYFREAGQPCPEGYNVADHMLDLAAAKGIANNGLVVPVIGGGGVSSSEHQGGLRNRLFGRKVERREVATEEGAVPPALRQPSDSSTSLITRDGAQASNAQGLANRASSNSPSEKHASSSNPFEHHRYEVGFLTQFSALTRRSTRNLIRTPSLLLAHMLIAIVLGAFVGGLYFRSDSSLGGIQNRLGSLVFVLALLGFSGLSAIGYFAGERSLVIRERANGFYGAWPLFLSRILFDTIALRVLPALLMGVIVFFMIGFTAGGDHFVKYIVIVLLFSAEMGLLCTALSIAIADVGTATLLASIIILFMMLFAGFLINQDNIPAPLHWIQYLSYFRYAYEALAVNDLTDVTIADNVSGASFSIPASVILSKFGFSIGSYFQDLFITIGFVVKLLIINGILVLYMLKERR